MATIETLTGSPPAGREQGTARLPGLAAGMGDERGPALRGRVLPIGGLKEKMLAAHRAGITTFLLPKKNAKDLVELPEKVREMEIIEVDRIEEVLDRALIGGLPNGPAKLNGKATKVRKAPLSVPPLK